TRLARSFDVVVAQRLPVSTMRSVSGATRVVYDLYVPSAIENLAYDALNERSRRRVLSFRLNMLENQLALASGDAFVCASEAQRDFIIGGLVAAGRVDHAAYERDPSLRSLV